MMHSLLLLLLVAMMTSTSLAWSPFPLMNSRSKIQHTFLFDDASDGAINEEESASTKTESRRKFLAAAAMQVCLMGASIPAVAAEPTVYKSGKTPLVPGQKPKDKNDVKGSKKDPDFLRSVADCRNQCVATLGSDGLAKSKEDCLSECQDICCTTYEQCTFNIVPRI